MQASMYNLSGCGTSMFYLAPSPYSAVRTNHVGYVTATDVACSATVWAVMARHAAYYASEIEHAAKPWQPRAAAGCDTHASPGVALQITNYYVMMQGLQCWANQQPPVATGCDSLWRPARQNFDQRCKAASPSEVWPVLLSLEHSWYRCHWQVAARLAAHQLTVLVTQKSLGVVIKGNCVIL
jgi:hypothetical protein